MDPAVDALDAAIPTQPLLVSTRRLSRSAHRSARPRPLPGCPPSRRSPSVSIMTRRRWLGWRRWGSPGWRHVAVIGWRWRPWRITFAPRCTAVDGTPCTCVDISLAMADGRLDDAEVLIHEASELVGSESPLMPCSTSKPVALAHLRGSPAHFTPTSHLRFTHVAYPRLGGSTAERP